MFIKAIPQFAYYVGIAFLFLGVCFSKAFLEISLGFITFIGIIMWFREPKPTIKYLWIWLLFLFYFLIISIRLPHWAVGLREWFNYFEYFILIVVLSRINVISKLQKQLYWILVISLLIIIGDSLYQYLNGIDILRSRSVNEYNNVKRLTGPFSHPNMFGGFLAIIIPICISLLYEKSLSIYKKVIISVIIIFLALLLLKTYSRGGWVGVVVGVYLYALIKDWRWFVVALILLIISPLIFPESIIGRMNDILNFENVTTQMRFESWNVAWGHFCQHPLFGIGLGQYSIVSSDGFAHNSYLDLLTEVGLIGFGIWIVLIGVMIIPNLNKQHMSSPFHVGLISASASFLAHSFIDTNFHAMPLITLFWLCLGLLNYNIDA